MILRNYTKVTIYTTDELANNLKSNLMHYSPFSVVLEDVKKLVITGGSTQEFTKMIELIISEEIQQRVFEYLHTYYLGKYPVLVYSSSIIMP